jgi:hypothetical protein
VHICKAGARDGRGHIQGVFRTERPRRAAEPVESTNSGHGREMSRTKAIDALTRMERPLTIS